VKHWPILIIFGTQYRKKFDINDYSLAHLTLILLLHYLVKCKNRSLGVYNEFIQGSACVSSENHWDHKSSEICRLFSISCTHFKIVRQWTKIMHQQWVRGFQSRGYWTCCWPVASTTRRLRSRAWGRLFEHMLQ